jgi:hypothetical protein
MKHSAKYDVCDRCLPVNYLFNVCAHTLNLLTMAWRRSALKQRVPNAHKTIATADFSAF